MGKDALQRSLPFVVSFAALLAIGLSIPRFYDQPAPAKDQSANTYNFDGNVTSVENKANDAEIQTDVRALSTQLEAYYVDIGNGSYPSTEQLVSSTWRAANLKGMDESVTVLPGGEKLGSASYSYVPTPSGCNGATQACTSFIIDANQPDGTPYSKYSLNY
ncbi:MAG: hypothetical protein ACMG55_19150 [Microcoleus sp.]